jgi:ABC-type transport system involved in cytochrome bd biosynthesis fused ATPase/permease subunit
MKLEEEFPVDYDNCYTSIALDVENISFKFPDSKIKILNNISLTVNQGERILLRDQTDLENNFNSNFIRINSTQSGLHFY